MFSLQKYKESAGFPVCVLSHKAPRALASLRGWRSCELLKVSSRTDGPTQCVECRVNFQVVAR